MAPGHRVTDCALAQRQIERPANQQLEPVVKLVADSGQRQMLDPGGSELDRQRKAVELATYLNYEQGRLSVELEVLSRSLPVRISWRNSTRGTFTATLLPGISV